MQKFEELQIFKHSVKSSLGPVWNARLRTYEQREISNCYLQNGNPPMWASAWGWNKVYTAYVCYKDIVKFIKVAHHWYGVALRVLTDIELAEVVTVTKARILGIDEKESLPDIVKGSINAIFDDGPPYEGGTTGGL